MLIKKQEINSFLPLTPPPSRNSITQLTLINSTSGHEPFEKVEFHASNQKPLSGIEFAYGWPGFYEWSYGNTLLPVGAFFPAFSSKLLLCYSFVLIHTILNNRNVGNYKFSNDEQLRFLSKNILPCSYLFEK